jgi:hypothetical protein
VVQVHVEGTSGAARRRGLVSVERRREVARREGHTPPVIVAAEADSVGRLMAPLISIARDNVRVARGLLEATGAVTARF